MLRPERLCAGAPAIVAALPIKSSLAAQTHELHLRILSIPLPPCRILRDVAARVGKLLPLFYDALKIIPLPDRSVPAQFFIRPLCHCRLLRPHSRPPRFRLPTL